MTLDDIFTELENRPTPSMTEAERARNETKRAEEHERGVRLEWWDEDGIPFPYKVADEYEDEDEWEDEEDEI